MGIEYHQIENPTSSQDTAIYNYGMTSITVRKLDDKGNEKWRYSGEVLERYENCVVLEAYFNRQDLNFHGMLMQQGDRFIETYYTDRWYNIFEIHDHHDDSLRGWYVNIGYPALIEGNTLSYKDLALDVLIFPDGRQLVLDWDEFEMLELAPEIRAKALAALDEVQKHFPKARQRIC